MFTREQHPVRNQTVMLRLTSVEKAALWLIAEEDEIALSEVLRRGLDLYVKKRKKDPQLLSSPPSRNQL